MTKYIFVTGGVVSSLGKGIVAASLGALLKARNYKIKIRKLDPYLNVDPGTMSPFEHGEVFVTADGAETDLDLGHYERFTGIKSAKNDSTSAGRLYATLLEKERRGEYLGKTVQTIPHFTQLIKDFIVSENEGIDFVITEIGGTVGDIEGLPFFESIRQLGHELDMGQSMFIHLTLIPYISAAQEIKTKPTQHSVKELRSIGIQPNILMCRSEKNISQTDREKIALFCNVHPKQVILAKDVSTIYEAPLAYQQEGLDKQVLRYFGLPHEDIHLEKWVEIVKKIKTPKPTLTIAIVGKYTGLGDAYKSINEAFLHASVSNNVKVLIKWVDARMYDPENKDIFLDQIKNVQGILVPGGFGKDGTEGKIAAIEYARVQKIPYFGICLGMQLAVIESARNIANLPDANSTEFSPECKNPIISLMTEWDKNESKEKRSEKSDLGGTLRLGEYPCTLDKNSKAFNAYKEVLIKERHRHRYELNIAYKSALEKAGVLFSGMSPCGKLTEIIERPDHPWFVSTQFHPEFTSNLFSPHPLFVNFVKAAMQSNS